MPSSRAKHAAVRISPALLRRRPLPSPGDGDKDARGCVFVVGGARQMPGALVLAATAALRAGAGKLQLGAGASYALAVATEIPEALVEALPETRGGGLDRRSATTILERANAADALVIGPGLVDESASSALLQRVVAALSVPAVLDATVLPCLHDTPDLLRRLHARVVLTPHAGEMARMLGCERAAVERDRVSCALDAAKRFNAIVALKGAQTYIAAPDGALFCNTEGTVGLATSGSGDTLAGIVGGLLARGASPLDATLWGVYVHARAGAALVRKTGMGFLARELLAEIPPVIKQLSA